MSQGLLYGADGFGCFFLKELFSGVDRIDIIRKYFLAAPNSPERSACIAQLTPLLTEDFVHIFRSVNGRRLIVKLLDDSVDSFFPKPTDPKFDYELKMMAEKLSVDQSLLKNVIIKYQESSSRYGCNGCRFSIMFPDLFSLQVKSITSNRQCI